MDFKKHKKAWVEFDVWLELYSINKNDVQLYNGDKYKLSDLNFNSLPFEMQVGAYIKYFDEKGIGISSNKNMCSVWSGINCLVKYDKIDRQKALKQAIEKAFSIREQQLNK